jgi:carbamoyltransferase
MILGINAFHGDAAAAALADGQLALAIAEERLTRVKHWAGFPSQAIAACLDAGGAGDPRSVEAVGVSRDPRRYFLRKASLALRHPRTLRRALTRWRNLGAVSGIGERLASLWHLGPDDVPRVHAVEHHLAHAASAFFCSPHEEASCLTVDGFGDFASCLLGVGRGTAIEVLSRIHFPHSLGLFYTAMTQYLGFPHYGDEYKVMGLAAYGEPTRVSDLRRVVYGLPDGSFRLDLAYFRHLREGVEMTWDGGEPRLGTVYTPRLAKLLGPAREPGADVEQAHKDLAASVQQVYEERLFALVRALVARSGLRDLCLAGGCAQNSVANGKLHEEAGIERLFVQPAAGDDGTALGAALFVEHAVLGRPRRFVMDHASWGKDYDASALRAAVADALPGSSAAHGQVGELLLSGHDAESDLLEETAGAIARGEVVGWFQGRSEWGPRALGNRSILADPRRPDMRDLLNRKIKRRESFRPFAPSIMEERVGEWFVGKDPDPFMTRVYPIREDRRAAIPAVTHVDGTGRLQTVSKTANPRYHGLIASFERQTGVPILLNTSFNENEPIVETPAEALDCFMRTRMDRLVLGDLTLRRMRTAAPV